MLRELRVKNYAIMEVLSLRLGPALNVLTGETGAGKSIIVGALGMALGHRASAEMVKTGASEASVEACFEGVEERHLESLGIAKADEVVIRRTISASGKSRAFVNDTMASVQGLSELGRGLVDMHGQHEHQSLLSPESQLRLLDRYGGLEAERAEVERLYEEAHGLEKRLNELKRGVKDGLQRLDLLRFQINEIDSASPQPGEDARLKEEIDVLANLGRLKELIEDSYGLLYVSEGSCLEKLQSAIGRLKEISAIDKGVSEPLSLLESALPLIEDAALSVRGRRDGYEADPERLLHASDRLDALKRLINKYGGTVEAVLRYRDEAMAETGKIETSDELHQGLEKELEAKEKALDAAATGLSGKRKAAARSLSASIMPSLRELALEKAEFAIDLKGAPISKTGADEAEFLFSANSGEARKPLSKVASGGELSRVMLAIKGVLRDAGDIPVLIFDEVDAGIGGKTAGNVASKLKALSAGRQVICITHLPQIASLADSHFLIEKEDKKGKVRVSVRELDGKARQEEIARMLSGRITETSLRHAREILGGERTLFEEK